MNRRKLLAASLITCFAMIGLVAATEKVPRDKVIHPIMTASSPELLPESRRDPEYPETLKNSKLGAELVLQIVIDESGKVAEVSPFRTTVWERISCSSAQDDRREKNPKKDSVRKASRQFEESAVSTVKQWKYRPATMQGIPTKVLQLVIVSFDPCSAETPQ